MGAVRGPNAAGRASRIKIVRAATDLVTRLGHRYVSIKQVAEASGMTDAGVLHHFSTKEELLNAVLDARDYDDETSFSAGTSVTGFLELMRVNSTRPNIVRLFATLSIEATNDDNPVHDQFAARYQRATSNLETDIRARQASGELRDDVDAASVARLIVAASDGLQVQWLFDDTINIPDIFTLLAAVLTNNPRIEPAQ